jgi:glycosyltransferase involved in cell wall biosynthesis
MRIALVVPGGVGADGVHEVVPALLALIGRLAARHDVLVIATEQPSRAAEYELRGARIRCLGQLRSRPPGRIRVAAAALAGLRDFRPDIIHAIWLGPGSTIAVLASALLRVPVIASVAGGELVWLPRIRYGGAGTSRGRLHARLALSRAAAVTAGSIASLELVRRRRPDARWLPLGTEHAEPRGAARLPPGSTDEADGSGSHPFRVLVVASVNRVKGPDVVLGALARARATLLDGVALEWIGEDTLGGSGAALARALDVTDLARFRGLLDHRRVLEELRIADLLVQGSYHEGQGVAVLEAAMAGVPTVGTATGLVAELAAADPPAAVAAPVGDAAALGDAVVAVARDPERRARLGAAARTWALAHDADWTAATFEELYRTVRGGGP